MASDSDNFNDSNSSSIDNDYVTLYAVKFWLLLIFLIPSIIGSSFVLCYLLCNRTARRALHNHAIFIFLLFGLIYEVTVYPWMIYFYHHNGIWTRSPFFCTVWLYIDWGLYFTQTILLAWATMERHILIFHNKWVSTKKKRLFVHYLPLIIIMVYCLIYYTVVIFFPPCENHFNDSYMFCTGLCLFQPSPLLTYDTIVHQCLPNFIIIGFSIALLVRVRSQKKRVGQSLQWRKHWKMTIQLIFVSIIYLVFTLPITLMNFLYLCGLDHDVGNSFVEYAQFLNYVVMLIFPFICGYSLPQLRNKIKNIMQSRRQGRIVGPATLWL